jgi:hypothetical protein
MNHRVTETQRKNTREIVEEEGTREFPFDLDIGSFSAFLFSVPLCLCGSFI